MKILNCSIRTRGRRDSNTISVTFDDGPHVNNTPRILDIIEKKSGHGTFFFTGNNLQKNRKLAEEVVSRGHMLGNHTFSHCKALFCSREQLYKEISQTKDLIEDISQKSNTCFRPPHGVITPALLSVCGKLGLTVVLWSANTMDFKRGPSEKMVQRVEKKIKKGTIVLFHECHFQNESLDYSNGIAALESVMNMIEAEGLKAVTLDGFL